MTKINDNILIKADFEERDRLRSFVKGMVWDPNNRGWLVPATISTYKNLKDFSPSLMEPTTLSPVIREWYLSLLDRATRLDELQRGTEKDPQFDPAFIFPIPMFKHQKDAVAFGLNLPKAAIWLDLGLGKTYVSITIARYRHEIFNTVSKVIVVTPLSTIHQWKNQINQYAQGANVVIIDGNPSRKQRQLDALSTSDAFTFVLATYESLANLDFDNVSFDMFILDEATKIKNPKAIRTKATLDLCSAIPYGVELTGLAYLNNPTDLYSQFLALDPTVYGLNQYSFEEHYINWIKRPFGRIMGGIKNMDELKRRAYFIAFSRSKKNCLDLPEKVYTTRAVPMYEVQAEWYQKVREEALGKVSVKGDQLDLKGVLAQMEKLQQITSGFVTLEDGKTIWFDSPKYEEAIETIESSDNNFIIWIKHRKCCEHIMALLESKGISAYELSRWVSDIKRDDAIKAFKKGICKVLVCSLQSECRGLDLTSAKSVDSIYLENDFSIDIRWQSESRQHRIGMHGSATYVDIVCEDTLDEFVTAVLAQKKNISEYIMELDLNIALGKGGTITTRKTRSKKVLKRPEDIVEEQELPEVHGL